MAPIACHAIARISFYVQSTYAFSVGQRWNVALFRFLCDPLPSYADTQAEQIDEYARWLQRTPSITSVRVNTLRTTVAAVQTHIVGVLQRDDHLPDCPTVDLVPELAEAIRIGRLAAHPAEPRHAAKEIIVDVACAAAILRGAHIYAPGVLAMQTNTKCNEPVNVYADLDGGCRKGFNGVYASAGKRFVGVGLVQMQRFQLFGEAKASGIAVRMTHTVSGVPSIGDAYLRDHFALLQNLPSIVCGRVLDPQPGERILDMCAAPGNKTTHLAQLMRDTGRISALDRSERRVQSLRDTVKRFGLSCIHCCTFDATKAVARDAQPEAASPPFRPETFDRVLLDAPCSGLGNRPVLATKMSLSALRSYPKVQKKLLDAAAELVRPGGIVVYSTCTVIPAENETNVAWFLAKYGDIFELMAAEPMCGRSGLPNVGLSDGACRMVQNFRPALCAGDASASDWDSTGFFICKLRKKASTLAK